MQGWQQGSKNHKGAEKEHEQNRHFLCGCHVHKNDNFATLVNVWSKSGDIDVIVLDSIEAKPKRVVVSFLEISFEDKITQDI